MNEDRQEWFDCAHRLKAEVVTLEENLSALRTQHEMVRQCCMDETVRATRLMEIVADLREELDHKDQTIANLCTAMRKASVASGSQVISILLEELDGPDAKPIPPHQEILL